MGEDRISQLPDAILQQMLSLIDINQAVQTSILSRRWKNLWLSLSDLHFHLTCFAAQASSDRFSHFVSNFLSRRDDTATIRSFHISFDRSVVHADKAFMKKCVVYAVNHGVQSLHFHARCSQEPMFFASETLRELELRHFMSYVIYVPGKFCLPHLKTLYLESYVFINDGGLYALSEETFSGFSELERLTLRRCVVSGLVLKAPKLRFLEIIDDQESSYFHQAMILKEIYAPWLILFRYEGFFAFECSKVNLPMLEEVYFDIYKRVNVKGMHLKCVRMLHQFGNATTVSLTLDTLKVLEMDRDFIEQSPSPFPHMKRLKLMKGRWEISTVLRSVMNYLTMETLYQESLMVEFLDGVVIVGENLEDFSDDDDNALMQLLELLFGQKVKHHRSPRASCAQIWTMVSCIFLLTLYFVSNFSTRIY